MTEVSSRGVRGFEEDPEDPLWYKDAIIYHLHVKAFFDSSNDGIGDFKGLTNDKLYEGRDLDVTTDFRDVFAEAAYKQLGAKDLSKVFPNYSASASKFRSSMRRSA